MRVRHFDHVTVCVSDLEAARRFFTLLGFEDDKAVVITGEPFATYMGVDGIEADHVTLVLPGAASRIEVQLLHYRHPEASGDPERARLNRLGFNHICFAVDDIEAMVAHLRANGIEVRGELKDFHDRRLVFLTGPEGITVVTAHGVGMTASDIRANSRLNGSVGDNRGDCYRMTRNSRVRRRPKSQPREQLLTVELAQWS